jgi:hypothetical protein
VEDVDKIAQFGTIQATTSTPSRGCDYTGRRRLLEVMATGPGSSKTSRAPGDISRGTQETGATGEEGTPEKTPTPSQEFAERQAFADPAHKDDGGLRTQETAAEEGARQAGRESAQAPNLEEEE